MKFMKFSSVIMAGLITISASSHVVIAEEPEVAAPSKGPDDEDSGGAQEIGVTGSPAPIKGEAEPLPIVFSPRSSPKWTEVTSSRQARHGIPAIRTIVPRAGGGLTLEEQPTLCWYAFSVVEGELKFTIVERDGEKILAETAISEPMSPGMQCVRLSDLNVQLETNKTYEWFLTNSQAGPQTLDSDVTGGAIERIASPPELRKRRPTADARSIPVLLAEFGIWYDAVDSLSRLIDASPSDPALHRQRASLLEQAGLADVAEADRATADELQRTH